MLKFVPDTLLSESLKCAIKTAQAIARVNRNREFTPAHLLKGLLHKDTGLFLLLNSLKKDVLYLENWADAKIEACEKVSSLPAIAGDKLITDVLYEANNIRLLLSKDMIDPVHALVALSKPGIGFTYDQLKDFALTQDELIFPVTTNNEEAVLYNGGKNILPAHTATYVP